MEVTLLTEDTRVHYTGDGVTKEFSYSFNPIDLNYVKVYKNLQQITTPDVTVASGVVTFNVAPAEGDSVVIMREKPLTYDSGIASKGIISSDSLDNMAVDLLGQIQQVNEKLDRVPVYPIDTTMTGEEILNQFNQDVQTVKDSRVEVEGKAEEINNTVSSGLTEISNATSESKSQITEEKNAAISAVETSTAPLIQKAETAAAEAEASRVNAEEWAKSVDAENIVHRTGDETISGTKTFNNGIYCRNGNAYYQNMLGYTVGTVPSSNYYPNTVILNDENGIYFGFYGPEMLTDGSYSVRMGVRSQVNPSKYSILKIGFLADGAIYTSAPTPPASDNGTQIATTNWVSDPNKSTNVVHRSGDETIYGYKTFRNDNSMAKVFIQGNLGLSENPAISGGQAQLEFHDKNGEWEGIVGIERYTSGKRILKLQLKDQDDAQNRIELIRNENGVWYATCPTPPTTNNDKAIATTAWVRQVAALKDLSNVSSNIDYIIEQGGNNYQWYRIYKSGRLEQGGIYDNETNVSKIRKQITLLKPYKHKSYNITVTPMSDGCRGTVSGLIVSTTTLELQYTGDYGVFDGTVNCRYLSWKTDDAKGN